MKVTVQWIRRWNPLLFKSLWRSRLTCHLRRPGFSASVSTTEVWGGVGQVRVSSLLTQTVFIQARTPSDLSTCLLYVPCVEGREALWSMSWVRERVGTGGGFRLPAKFEVRWSTERKFELNSCLWKSRKRKWMVDVFVGSSPCQRGLWTWYINDRLWVRSSKSWRLAMKRCKCPITAVQYPSSKSLALDLLFRSCLRA